MANILLIEDDLTFAQILEVFLRKRGHVVSTIGNISGGINALMRNEYNLLLLDYRLPDGNGLDLVEKITGLGIKMPVVMMTSFNDVRTAVKAMRSGVFDYITKPINPDELLMVLNQVLNNENKQAAKLKAHTKDEPEFLAGVSDAARQLQRQIELVAPINMTVIIEGESGTGKENTARTIHQLSKRAAGPFVAIDCGAISENLALSELFGHTKGAFTGAINDKIGRFEEANNGTLFLDEVGNLNYDVQIKLLRVLQERVIQPVGSNKQIKADVRIITATNEDLKNLVKAGRFREDLYYRLVEFKIKVPALRQRDEDLGLFIDYFIKQANAELDKEVKKISPEVMAIFAKYDWPGNLRELKNVVKRMVLLAQGPEAGKDTLPDEMVAVVNNTPKIHGNDLKAMQETNEKKMIIDTLIQVKHNKSKAAKLLNIDRKTLYLKMEKYGIE